MAQEETETVLLAMLDIEDVQQRLDAQCLHRSIQLAAQNGYGNDMTEWLQKQQHDDNALAAVGTAMDIFRRWRTNLIDALRVNLQHVSEKMIALEQERSQCVQKALDAGVALLYKKVWDLSSQQYTLVRPCQMPNGASKCDQRDLTVQYIMKACNDSQCLCCEHSKKALSVDTMERNHARWMHKTQRSLEAVEKMSLVEFVCGTQQILQTVLLYVYTNKTLMPASLFETSVQTQVGVRMLLLPSVFMLWLDWEFDIKGDFSSFELLASFFGTVFEWPRTVGNNDKSGLMAMDPSWADNLRNIFIIEEFITLKVFFKPDVVLPCNNLNRMSLFHALMHCSECILPHLAPDTKNVFSNAITIHSQLCVGCQQFYAYEHDSSLLVNILLVLSLQHCLAERHDAWLEALHLSLMTVIEEEQGNALLAVVRTTIQTAVKPNFRARKRGRSGEHVTALNASESRVQDTI